MQQERLQATVGITKEDFDCLEKTEFTIIGGNVVFALNQRVKLYGLTHLPLPLDEDIYVKMNNWKQWHLCKLRFDSHGLVVVRNKDNTSRSGNYGVTILKDGQTYCISIEAPFVNRGTLYGIRKLA